jgi:DMSO/TMAO reductase YedYZ molybdopterin-dependent catalytic subunit
MKKTRFFVSLLIVFALITACTSETQEEVLLNVDGTDFTQSELEALGTMSVDYTDKEGETTTYEGVLLSAVLEAAGVADAGSTVTFTAADGYEAEMPTDEALACDNCIVAFDENSLRMVMPDQSGKLQVKDVVQISVN